MRVTSVERFGKFWRVKIDERFLMVTENQLRSFPLLRRAAKRRLLVELEKRAQTEWLAELAALLPKL